MKDRVHQPYRKALVSSLKRCPVSKPLTPVQIPGLPEVLSSVTPETHQGLLGICLSGAGPTILILATKSFESIAEGAAQVFKQHGVEVDWKVLEVAGGSVVSK